MVGESLVVGFPHLLGIDFPPWHQLGPIDGGTGIGSANDLERTSL